VYINGLNLEFSDSFSFRLVEPVQMSLNLTLIDTPNLPTLLECTIVNKNCDGELDNLIDEDVITFEFSQDKFYIVNKISGYIVNKPLEVVDNETYLSLDLTLKLTEIEWRI